MNIFFNNPWMWVIATTIIGLLLLVVIPHIFKSTLNTTARIIFDNYFGSKLGYDMAKNKIWEEIVKFKQIEKE